MGRRKKSKPMTLAVVIQDKSGSMHGRENATISGFNEYLDGLRDDHDGDYLITLTQFDHEIEKIYTATPLANVPDLNHETYKPRGATRLYDAIGETLKSVERFEDEVDNIIVVIMTDGEENSSTDYGRKDILTKINLKRMADWDFVFLGAGEDSWSSGEALGFTQRDSVFYGGTVRATEGAYGSLVSATVGQKEGLRSFNNAEFTLTKANVENLDDGKLAKEEGKLVTP